MTRVYLHRRQVRVSDAALAVKLAEDEEKEREAMVEKWSDEDAREHSGIADKENGT